MVKAPGYEEMYSFQNLYRAHIAARKGKRSKPEVIEFEMNLAENLVSLQRELQDHTYQLQPYYAFTLYEPKERHIFAPHYRDRVVQHCLCDNILMPTLEKRLIYDNAACRKSKGTHFAMRRLTGSGKVLRRLRTQSKQRIRRRMQGLQKGYSVRLLDWDDVCRSIVSTNGHLMHGHTWKFREKEIFGVSFVKRV